MKASTKPGAFQFEKAVTLNKQFVAAKLILGDLYLQQGQKDKSKAQHQAVIDMKPFGLHLVPNQQKLGGIK